MDDRPSPNRDLLIPIIVGGFSIFGIAVILLVGRINASREPVPVLLTDTPFKFIYLGTEPGIFTESPEALPTELPTDIPIDNPTFDSGDLTPVIGTPVLETPLNTAPPGSPPDNTGGPPINGTPGIPTPSSQAPDPMTPGTYDDTDYRLVYDGPWFVGQGTHVSSSVGSSATFRYIGSDWRLQYQAGPGLGTMSIEVDDVLIDTLNQSDGISQSSQWYCAQCAAYSNVVHEVVLTHISGGSVNLDKIFIPGVSTPTVTPTRTP